MLERLYRRKLAESEEKKRLAVLNRAKREQIRIDRMHKRERTRKKNATKRESFLAAEKQKLSLGEKEEFTKCFLPGDKSKQKKFLRHFGMIVSIKANETLDLKQMGVYVPVNCKKSPISVYVFKGKLAGDYSDPRSWSKPVVFDAEPTSVHSRAGIRQRVVKDLTKLKLKPMLAGEYVTLLIHSPEKNIVYGYKPTAKGHAGHLDVKLKALCKSQNPFNRICPTDRHFTGFITYDVYQ